jgi:DNA-binding beta-propeller fold protein YncE
VGRAAADGGWEFDLEFGDFAGPDGIAIDSQGDVYVLDRGNGPGSDGVKVFTPDGKFLREHLGFDDPGAIAIDENDVMYVVQHCRVHRYSLQFQYFGAWDSCIGQGESQHGRGIDAKNGLVYVATVSNVLKFTSEGVFLDMFPAGWVGVSILLDWQLTAVESYLLLMVSESRFSGRTEHCTI